MDDKKARELMEKELNKLKEVAVTSTNGCVVAEYIAISDKNVQDKFLLKLAEGYVFKGITCTRGQITEQRRVEFHFECAPGTFCFVSPSMMVIVDIISKTIVKIFDPYIGEDKHQELQMHQLSDGHAPWPFDKPGRTNTIAWDGWGPFMTRQTEGLPRPEIKVLYEGPQRARLVGHLIAPNGCYLGRPPYQGLPSEVIAILPEQVGIVLPVQYLHQRYCPPHTVPVDWDISFATEGKTSVLAFTTLNDTIAWQTSIDLSRSSVQYEKELTIR